MSEIKDGTPTRSPQRFSSLSGDRARELAGIKSKQGLLAKMRNVILAGIGIAGAGAAVEATAHPIETTTNTAVSVSENVANGLEKLVRHYYESPAVRQISEEVAGKLNGTIPLSEGERIEKIKLVPAGATFEEREEMKKNETLINIRNYPGAYTPDGRFSSVIGKLPQGTIIEQAILITGNVPYAVNPTDTAQWWGFIYKEPGQDPNEPGKIGFAFGIYGEPVKTESNSQISPTSE